MRSLITYYGGKRKDKWSKIIPHFPCHKTFVDVFGGAANILLNKPPAPIEIYNDINTELANLFRVARDYPEELRRALELTLYSRAEWDAAIETVDGQDPVERARKTIVKYRQSYGGKGDTWMVRRKGVARGMSASTSAWLSNIDTTLPAVAERLQRVQIECAPWQYILERYDNPGVLFYCDPPYYPHVRSEGKIYPYEMSAKEHEELAIVLNTLRGDVVLSGYMSDAYNIWYANWRCVDFDVPLQVGKKKEQKQQRRTEMLWIKQGQAP